MSKALLPRLGRASRPRRLEGEAWRKQFPLRAQGCFLVNQYGERFKLAGINWYGASDAKHVVGGLDIQPLAEICKSVAAMGFTVVRLPFSSEMLRATHVVDGAINYDVNPELRGLTPLEIYDRTLEALGAAGVAVVLNNHTTLGMWSGGVETNGLWFIEGSTEYTEMSWINDWLFLARRYKDLPHVIAYDLRNEVRPVAYVTAPGPCWGDGGDRDWARAAGNCARSLLDAGHGEGLIIVERICWPQQGLDEMLHPKPPWEAWGVPRERLMLALHMYSWSGPGSWSPKAFTGTMAWAIFHAVDYVGSRALYGELSMQGEEQFVKQMDKEWGWVLKENLCPVWLSEFGADLTNPTELVWFDLICRYLEDHDADFAYWPLNVGPKPGGDGDESYGLLTNDWQPRWTDARYRALRRLLPHAPLLPGSPRRARARNLMSPSPLAVRRGLGLDLVTPVHEREHRPDEAASAPADVRHDSDWAAPGAPGSPFGLHDADATSHDGEEDDEEEEQEEEAEEEDCPSLALPPRCAPLPGPLAPWPDSAPDSPCASSPSRTPSRCRRVNLPAARYYWSAEAGFDVDPGRDARVVGGSLEEMKRACIEGGFGGFALFEGYAYMRQGSVEELRKRVRGGFKSTVLFLAEEIRLCQVVEEVSGAADPGGGRGEEPDGGSGGPRLGSRVGQQVGDKAVVLTRKLALVHIGLREFVGKDAFPGSNGRVLRGANLAQCRQICLEEGFGGFVVFQNDAYFRTASGPVLERHFIESSPETVFYVLTASEVHGKLAHGDDAPRGRAEVLQRMLPRLWSAKADTECDQPAKQSSFRFFW